MNRTAASARPFVAPSSLSLPPEHLAFSIATRHPLSREFFNSIGQLETFGSDAHECSPIHHSIAPKTIGSPAIPRLPAALHSRQGMAAFGLFSRGSGESRRDPAGG